MIYNLGSINIDYFYSLQRLPLVGETCAADEFETGLGGKGANMSVAIARAGGEVRHIGSIGHDAAWAQDYLTKAGVETSFVQKMDAPTGHAVIYRDAFGENTIVIHPGANVLQDKDWISSALANSEAGDILLLQNETNLQDYAAALGHGSGFRVAYAAAPFDANALQAVLPYIHILILNEVELAQLCKTSVDTPDSLDVDLVVVTKGSEGCAIYSKELGETHMPALPVTAIDTTGAGDTFTGFFLAQLDRGCSVEDAATCANAAAALMVTRKGTADAIPSASDVEQLLA
ncbi:ribokinase [Roseovarius phycicola]|uniref:Ribokinase n=1 Tax=Roseovarius phycicola TaxID=3080976 RepID=A0ABZ2HGA4_9RHOB